MIVIVPLKLETHNRTIFLLILEASLLSFVNKRFSDNPLLRHIFEN